MRAVIESAKFEKKSRKKDAMQQGRKAKKSEKKVLLQLLNNSSGLCTVAGVQWHHTNELTMVLSLNSECKFEKKKKKERKVIQRRKAKR